MALPDPRTAKYLYSPKNGIVCINTAQKRKMCPWAIPCNKIDASDIMDDPHVTTVYQGEYDSRKAEEEAAELAPPAEEVTSVEDSFKALNLQIMSSQDKAEMRQIGADLGVDGLSKTMGLEKMRKTLLDRIDLIREQT
jgi:hypothetical protein